METAETPVIGVISDDVEILFVPLFIPPMFRRSFRLKFRLFCLCSIFRG